MDKINNTLQIKELVVPKTQDLAKNKKKKKFNTKKYKSSSCELI